MYWNKAKTYEKHGLTYTLSYTNEDSHPKDLFDDTLCDIDEILRKIDDGTYYWIMLRFEAVLDGAVLGTEYLGGVLVENLEDLDEYIDDMEAEVNYRVVAWLEQNKPLLDTLV